MLGVSITSLNKESVIMLGIWEILLSHKQGFEKNMAQGKVFIITSEAYSDRKSRDSKGKDKDGANEIRHMRHFGSHVLLRITGDFRVRPAYGHQL